MLGVLSAWLKVLNTRTKNNLIRRFPFSLSPVNIGAILNNPRALLYGFCCHVIYAPVFIGHFVINLDWPFSQPSLKDPANSPSWTQFSWNLDALPSFKFPLFFEDVRLRSCSWKNDFLWIFVLAETYAKRQQSFTRGLKQSWIPSIFHWFCTDISV